MTPDQDAAHGLATHYVASQRTPQEMGEGNMMRDMLAISEAYLELYEAHARDMKELRRQIRNLRDGGRINDKR